MNRERYETPPPLTYLSQRISDVPKVYSLEFTPQCVNRYMVMDFVGEQSLNEWSNGFVRNERKLPFMELFSVIGPPKIEDRDIALIAVKVISILRDIHSLGLVHGDINLSKFIVGDPANPGASLKLTEFQDAIAFIDPETGAHKEEAEHHLFLSYEDDHPPLQLGKISKSRRDDMSRASWMLMDLSQNPKRLLTDFYKAMYELKFDERPKYEDWITVFKNAAEKNDLQ